MNPWSLVDGSRAVFFLYSTAAIWAFILIYWWGSNWRQTVPGRLDMAFKLVVGVIMISAVLIGILFPDRSSGDRQHIWGVVALGLYAALSVILTRLVISLRRVQRGSRRGHRARKPYSRSD